MTKYGKLCENPELSAAQDKRHEMSPSSSPHIETTTNSDPNKPPLGIELLVNGHINLLEINRDTNRYIHMSANQKLNKGLVLHRERPRELSISTHET